MQTITRIGDDHLMHDRGTQVAIIRQVRITRPAGHLWRSVTWDSDPSRRKLIGYFPSLEMAVHVTWRTWAQRNRPAEEVAL